MWALLGMYTRVRECAFSSLALTNDAYSICSMCSFILRQLTRIAGKACICIVYVYFIYKANPEPRTMIRISASKLRGKPTRLNLQITIILPRLSLILKCSSRFNGFRWINVYLDLGSRLIFMYEYIRVYIHYTVWIGYAAYLIQIVFQVWTFLNYMSREIACR